MPADLVLALGCGVVSGAAVLLIFGAPNKRPRGPEVVDAMARAGVPLRRLARAGVDARSSTPYFGEAEDGRSLFIKVLGRDERSADLMFRLYRFLRVKNVGDRGPFTSLQRMVEHEAFVALYSSDMDILTPRLVVSTSAGSDGFLLAYERVAGDSLDRVEDEAITDEVLQSIWRGVGLMRSRRIAHRDLRLANVLLAPDQRPWLIDFGFAEIAATDEMLDTDVAELLSSTALKVGVNRAVDAAIAVIGKAAVASAAPRIQPLALSTATRKSLVARKPLCDDLRKYAGEASGAGDVEPQDLQRIKWRTLLVFVSLAIAFYLLIPQLADVSGVWSKIKQADLTWALYALGASALTYVGAALTLTGAVPARIRFFSTLGTQLAGSFVNRIIPARVGGIATNVRYLQKQGIDLAVASSSVGLQQLSGLLVHVSHVARLPGLGRAQRCRGLRLPAVRPDGADRTHGRPGALRTPVPAPGRAERAAQTRHAAPEALGSGSEPGDTPAVQGGRAPGRVGAAHPLLHLGPGVQRPRLRPHRGERGQHRCGLPDRLRHQFGGADAGWHRRRGGRADRRAHRGRPGPGRGGARRVPLPHRHLLAADPAGVDRLRAAAAARRPVALRTSCQSPSGQLPFRDHPGVKLEDQPPHHFNGLHTRDVEAAKRFYGSVFGWGAMTVGGAELWTLPGYGDHLEQREPGLRQRLAEFGAELGFEDVVASINPIGDDQADVPAHWSVTFSTDDADKLAARAAELGGSVLLPPMDVPWARMTTIADPQGASFIATMFAPENRG